jgi:hypothetical protein
MRDKLIPLVTKYCAGILADYLISHGVTFADVPDNNVGDKEMIRHLFNRCAAITLCGLCFCCGYQKECERARDVFAKDGEA